MQSSVPVFNLGDSPVDYVYGGLDPVTVSPYRWQFVSPTLAANVCSSDPQLFVDFGPRSLSDYRLPWRMKGQKHLNVTGTIDAVSGYGRLTAHAIDALLTRPDINLSLTPSGYWHEIGLSDGIAKLMKQYHGTRPKERPYNPEGYRAWQKPSTPIVLPPRWSLAITIPPELAKVPSPRVLLYSMWESDSIPQRDNYMLTGKEEHKPKSWVYDPNAWPEWINARATLLAVPSEDMRQVFLRSKTEDGKSIQIDPVVVPPGIDPLFTFQPRTEHPTFNLLTYGELGPRKPALEMIVELIMPVLGEYEDWRLVVKTRGKTSIGQQSVQDPRIVVVNADYTPQQMVDLTHDADCMLCINRYEGWGLPLREGMAAGCVLIATNHSGQAEDALPDYCYPVPSAGLVDTWKLKSEWHEIDWEAARVALAAEYAAFKARRGAQSEMGARASAWIRERRTYAKMCDQLLGMIDRFETRGRS